MHPILYRFPEAWPLIGGLTIHFYGFMIALGFYLGMLWIKREAKRIGLDVDKVLDVFFYGLVAGLVGARVFYVLYAVPNFWSDPVVFFRVWEGGLVFQGGVIGTILIMIYQCRKHQLSFFQLADIFVPGLAIGHAMGRVGCFLAGCCHGGQCPVDFPLAVVFPEIADGAAPPGIPLYPTQLFEAGGEVLIFILLVTLRHKKTFDGWVFALYLFLYSILRFGLEYFRGDREYDIIPEPYLSNAQFISILAVIGVVFIWLIQSRQKKQ